MDGLEYILIYSLLLKGRPCQEETAGIDYEPEYLLRTIGQAKAINKRGIAGSLIWINFDRHALLNLFHKAKGKFVADNDEIRPQYQDSTRPMANAVFSSSIVRNLGRSVRRHHRPSMRLDSIEVNSTA